VAGYAGLLLATPTVLYEVIAYVVPGLTKSERRLLAPVIFGSSILFYLGCDAGADRDHCNVQKWPCQSSPHCAASWLVQHNIAAIQVSDRHLIATELPCRWTHNPRGCVVGC